MLNIDVGFIALGVAAALLPVALVLWLRWRRRDREYVGITPGLSPMPSQRIRERRVRGGKEWKGNVPVQFHPPQGVSPAVAGVIIDGSADPHDLGALVVDLSVRGWYDIVRIGKDWELRGRAQAPRDVLTPVERSIVDALFRTGPVQRMSQLKGHLGVSLREAQIGLYRDVVDRRWYRKHPRARNAAVGCLGLLVALAAVGLAASLLSYSHRHSTEYWWALPAGVLVGGVVMSIWGRGRTPRTAEGTAARIQTLGFRKYLETAEARQIRFEEAAGLFARYLPYAMVFGLADRWAAVIRDVLRQHRMSSMLEDASMVGDVYAWEMVGHLADLAGSAFDVGSMVSGISSLSDAVPADLGFLDGIDSGVGDLVSGVGDFASAAGDLFDGMDGCLDGCSGCGDLGGCSW